jgi:hypothetical protein
MRAERSSFFRRPGAWRLSFVLGLVLLLGALPTLLTAAAGVRGSARLGAHVAAAAAFEGTCRFASIDRHSSPGGDEHSDVCRLCLGAACAGPAAVPNAGDDDGLSLAYLPQHRAAPPFVFALARSVGPSGWGTSWTAQAPPSFG